MAPDTFAGTLLLPEGTVEGWVEVDRGRIVAWDEGPPEGRAVATGWIVPPPVNAHTHVADTFLRERSGKPDTVSELFGPGGWKHQQLALAQVEETLEGIHRYADEMAAVGTSHFIDFREGGLPGAQLLADLAPDLPVQPIILGRPASGGFDDEEAESLLRLVDGIGLSGLRDHPHRDLEAWAEACHDKRLPFSIHVSENARDDIETALALEPAFMVHMTQATRHDIQRTADEEVPIVVCPRSNAHFGQKPPVPIMLAAGCTVAVGTDNGMLQDGDLLHELALLRTLYPVTSIETLLRMVTHNGRALLGLPSPLPPRRGHPLELVVLPRQPLPAGPRIRPILAPRQVEEASPEEPS